MFVALKSSSKSLSFAARIISSAKARASSVFPTPGGPTNKNRPRGRRCSRSDDLVGIVYIDPEAEIAAERTEIVDTAMLPKNRALFETAEAAEVRIGYAILRLYRDPTPLIDRAGDAAVHAGKCTQIFHGTVLPAKGVAHKALRAKTEIWRVGIGPVCIPKDATTPELLSILNPSPFTEPQLFGPAERA